MSSTIPTATISISTITSSQSSTLSPTQTANSTGPFYVADPTVQGTVVLAFVSFLVCLVCIFVYEVLRHHKVFFKLFYTRVEACRKEAPDVPDGWFGWVKTAVMTPESYIVEKVGLDATMFLRFLRMSFIQFLCFMLVVTPILTGINYFSVNPSQSAELLRNQTQFSQLGLYQFSISNIPNGSNVLVAHAVFCCLVTAFTYYTLFSGFKEFAKLSSTYLREDNSHGSGSRPAWRANEALQLRTVLVQNIPKKLRSGPKLTQWFSSLGIGEVEIAILDRTLVSAGIAGTGIGGKHQKKNATVVVGKLIAERTKALNGLEKSFLLWAQNIDYAKKHIHYSKNEKVTVDSVWWHTKQSILKTSTRFLPSGGDGDSSMAMTSTVTQLDEETVQKLRPKVSWYQRRRASPLEKAHSKRSGASNDAIDFYTSHLNKLTAMVRMERVKALEWNVMKEKEDTVEENGSAFVTFKTQRAAQIACQVLLFSSFNRYKMHISLAPAPQDVIWSTISLHPVRRQIQSYIVNIICVSFTFFWVVPAGLTATMTNIEELAKVPSFRPLISKIAENEHLYVFLKTIGPPLVVNIFNVVIPYIFEFLIGLQGLEARSKIETRTLDHYFFFLLFNVLLVFTLSTAVLNMIGTFMENPASIIQVLANTLPNGATFFINYITITCVFFALELLRPAILIWNAFCKYSNLTPRQMHEMNLSTSYLNFGILYPIHILIFIIGLLYSIVAPLILIPATVYFGFGYIVYRHQLLFVYVKEWEAYGRHWSMAFTRIIAGLIIFQITMAGMFALKRAPICSFVPLALIPITVIFHNHCKATFQQRTRLVPLDQLPPPKKQEPVNDTAFVTKGFEPGQEFSLHHLLPKSRNQARNSPSSPRTPNGTLARSPPQQHDAIVVIDEVKIPHSPMICNTHIHVSQDPNESQSQDIDDVVLEPHVVLTPEESLLERYPVSYLNPVFSKPLARPWLPLAVAGWWQLLPRYVSEPELEIPEEVVVTVLQTSSAPELPTTSANDVGGFGGESQDALTAVVSPMGVGVSCSLDSLTNPKLDRLKKKATRRGSMAKGMVVVGMKDEVMRNWICL
ncbi:DUF221-domain-containing protein [Rhizoclosmatium globosum]|uniref:DUF221-domain-containing protein n=1 Tax=Rhizoclosmatium globosum TaxID=329046 RepID=A0A1Y2BTA5_9FUNG|nr:DUF221-domain-containing protein [Rhizoclosmatium globosum]|eukprot:ORY37990.1 DUF221-domain-containing protein [Rhizoclosmatium globosum]